MCLIIVSANFQLSFNLVASIYKRNSDGLGFVGGGQQPVKTLPKNIKEAWRFYKENIHGRAGAMHARWRTDGEISLERVHPYTILPGRLWMMHNGVLSDFRSGVSDPESDTEKYVNLVLRPLFKRAPTLWKQEEFKYLLAKQVGSGNRLVFVDHTGHTEIINRSTGYEVGPDWYANGYSFDSYDFFPDVFKSYGYKSNVTPTTSVPSNLTHYYPGKSYTDNRVYTPSQAAALTHGVPGSGKQKKVLSDEGWADQLAQQELAEYFETLNHVRAEPMSRKAVEEQWNLDLDSCEGLSLAFGFEQYTIGYEAYVSGLKMLKEYSPEDFYQVQHDVMKAYRDSRNDDDLDATLSDILAILDDVFDSYGIVTLDEEDDENRNEGEDKDANGTCENSAGSVLAGDLPTAGGGVGPYGDEGHCNLGFGVLEYRVPSLGSETAASHSSGLSGSPDESAGIHPSTDTGDAEAFDYAG